MSELWKRVQAAISGALPGLLKGLLGGLLSKALQWLLIGGLGLAALSAATYYVYHRGRVAERAVWEQREQAALEMGRAARDRAEASVPPAPATPPTRRCAVRDAFDRDCAK